MVTVLTMSGKVATLGFPKIKIFRNKGYDIIICVYDVINKKLSCDSNVIVDLIMWLKFGNFRTSMREVIRTSLL